MGAFPDLGNNSSQDALKIFQLNLFSVLLCFPVQGLKFWTEARNLLKKVLSTLPRHPTEWDRVVRAWLGPRNRVALHPGSSEATILPSAQWPHLKRSWHRSLHFPIPASPGAERCSTQLHYTRANLTAEGCGPHWAANQSAAPERRQGQKHFCQDVLYSIFLQPVSSWLRASGPGQP